MHKGSVMEEQPASALSCTHIDDLYALAARETLSRLLDQWLNHYGLTVTEFIHSASALEKFESAGTTYQHAVQRMAVLLAAQTKIPVVQIIKALNTLVGAAVTRVYVDERRGLFALPPAGNFAQMAVAYAGSPNAQYKLSGSLAKYLAAAKTWDEKLSQLLSLRSQAPKEGLGRALFLSAIDAIIADIIGNETALIDLLGAKQEFGQRLFSAVRIFRGIPSSGPDACAGGMNLLARHFACDEMPDVRQAFANFILGECQKPNRLCRSSSEDELEIFRQLVAELDVAETKYIDRNDLHAAFTERSKRFVTQEFLFSFMAAAKTPDRKIERLLMLAESIIGEANKRSLMPIALAILGGRNVEEEFDAGAPCVQRLKRCADLQKRLQHCGFSQVQREKMAALLDGIAVQIEAKGRFFALLEAQAGSPKDIVEAYLKLLTGGAFTEGNMMQKARRAVRALLASPELRAQYAGGGDGKAALTDVIARLRLAGISPENSPH